MEIEWIDDSKRTGHYFQLNMAEQNEYLDTLYHLSKATHLSQQVSVRAQEVYQVLRQSAKRQVQFIGQPGGGAAAQASDKIMFK